MLNTAENDVNMNPKRYAKEGICYKGFRCPDLPQADIGQFFDECSEFIDMALSFSIGKVFINCLLVSYFVGLGHLQGDPNLTFLLGVALKICISEPMLEKP